MFKRLLDSLAASALLGLVAVRLRLSEAAATRLAKAAGGLAYLLVPSRRRIALRNLRRAFGSDVPTTRLEQIVGDTYRLLAVSFSDMLALFRETREQFAGRLEVSGEENLRAALAKKRGILGVSAHFGAFPMLGAALPSLNVPFAFLYRRPKSAKTAKLFDDWLRLAGCGVIEDAPRHLAGIRCLEALEQGGCVCLLIDQHYPAGVEVPFFGHPAKTGVGAALLAVRSGAPLVPMRLTRLPDGRYRLVIEPEIPPPTDRSREALTECTARLTACIETWIREIPEVWFWVHRRWKDLDRVEDAQGVARQA